MATIAEIEAAIEKLSLAEFRELMFWLQEYEAKIGASRALALDEDEEEDIET